MWDAMAPDLYTKRQQRLEAVMCRGLQPSLTVSTPLHFYT